MKRRKERRSRTEQLRPIPPGNPHQFLLATGMIRQIRRDVVHFAIDGGPGVVFLVVKFQDGGRDAH